MMHVEGWSQLFPAEMGLQNDFSSLTCQQMKKITCKRPGWWHPENKCPPIGISIPQNDPLDGGN